MGCPDPTATVSDLLTGQASGAFTAEELCAATLERIEVTDGTVGAWLALHGEGALESAREVDRRRSQGESLGPLAGIPVGIKDMICMEGVPTTAGSQMLASFVPPYDATVIDCLRQADAIPIGKLNQDEFAMGSSNERSAFKPTRNPWDTARVPGGSSGGSAAAVAAGSCPLSLGTDTGGSIRQPASYCGVVGIKPTYGRISRYGVIAFASSLDQVGPLGRTVDDAARLLDVLCGHDPRDATSIPRPGPTTTVAGDEGSVKGLRVGVPTTWFELGMDPGVERCVRGALDALRDAGAELVEVELPHTRYAIAAYYVIATAEASSNLARYDGVRYGLREGADRSLEEMISATRSAGFGPEVKRRILLGTFALSSGYYDAYYLKAQKVRTLVRRDFEAAFSRVDVLAAPTAPNTAFPLGSALDDPLEMYRMDVFTIPASLAGLPCMSLPCGLDDAGLPVGLQLLAPPLGEETMVAAARAYESLAPDIGRPSIWAGEGS